MAISADILDRVILNLDDTIALSDLARYEWRRQTDVVKQSFILARLVADLGKAFVFVDGHMSERVKILALSYRYGPKAFINRRCHDAGLKQRRLIVLDTVTTKAMGGRGSSRARLHFHAAIQLPAGWQRQELILQLEKVFGQGTLMGRRQFHITSPNWQEHCSHKGVQASGPLGKLFYALKHAGSSYRVLDLNDGKRSRRAPSVRGALNRAAKRLAQGIPSNFNAKVVLCDATSKRLGKEAFEGWIHRMRDRPDHATDHRALPKRAVA